MPVDISYDCKYFVGEKPCRYKHECGGCKKYSPMGMRICIIKFGARGDVLRTTPLLYALKKKYDPCYITWVTDIKAIDILKENPLIDKVLPYTPSTILNFQVVAFDILINLDKAVEACALASITKAADKFGFGLNQYGTICPLNKKAEYAFRLGISNELKFFKNTNTYQEIIFDVCGLKYNNEPYIINIPKDDYSYAQSVFRKNGINKKRLTIGLNTGSGAVFKTKRWTTSGFATLSDMLSEKLGACVILLGGADETERNSQIYNLTRIKPVNIGTDHSLARFAAIISLCDLLVTGDTLALHLAIGLKVSTVAIFTSTCAQELDLYTRGAKLIPPVSCAPCYKGYCKEMKCAKSIKPVSVFDACLKIIKRIS